MSAATGVASLQVGLPKRKATFLWRFRQNRLAVFGAIVVAILVFVAVTANFTAPSGYNEGILAEARQFGTVIPVVASSVTV